MANILAVGIATLDIINTVETYPHEDSEVRVLTQRKTRGGNATNSLVVLSQLGHHCHWAGVLINEPDAQVVENDLSQYSITSHHCIRLDNGKIPTSYITLSQHTASRSIIHHRDCPEYNFEDFKKIDLTAFDWVHFEGRNIDETRLMLEHLTKHHPELPCSLEIEKARPGIESLFHLPTILLFSKNYALARNIDNASSLLKLVGESQDITATCTWGMQGAWAITQNHKLLHSKASELDCIVDTIGAGDTFNAGLINSLVKGENLASALSDACLLAGRKCQQQGFANLVENQ